jgi:hypothetical protein
LLHKDPSPSPSLLHRFFAPLNTTDKAPPSFAPSVVTAFLSERRSSPEIAAVRDMEEPMATNGRRALEVEMSNLVNMAGAATVAAAAVPAVPPPNQDLDPRYHWAFQPIDNPYSAGTGEHDEHHATESFRLAFLHVPSAAESRLRL